MKCTALLLLAAVCVSAHWTHDESLAREIGPPPGEEDVEISSLEEEQLIQEGDRAEAKTGAVKQYRITFGTSVVAGTLGASMSQFKVHLKGAKMDKPGKWVEDKTWKSSDDGLIRYYQGVGMPYAVAKQDAPGLRPGMTPLSDTNVAGCSVAVKGIVKPCPAATAKGLTVCEPMSKSCKRSIKMGSVAYTPGKVATLVNGINYGAGDERELMGPIQRGQFSMDDVGKIVQVKISELKAYTPSDPCYSKATGFKRAMCSSPWRPAFVKISTNDPQTGIGDGTYYIAPCDAATLQVGVYVMPGGKGQPDIEKGPVDLVAKQLFGKKCAKEQNAVLTKCMAQTCEEEMDTKLGMMDKTKYEFSEEI